MTAPIGNLLAPTACEDTLQQGADNFNKHIGCTTQDDHAQYMKTCSVRRVAIDVVYLSTVNAPDQSVLGNYPTLAFSTASAQQARWSVGIPSNMNVEKESSLYAVLAAGTASTESIRSVLDYVNTCYAGGNPTAAAASTANTVCTTGANAVSTASNTLAEIKVATFTSGTFYQSAAISMAWTRKSSSTANSDARPGLIHVTKFVFQYYDRRTSTST